MAFVSNGGWIDANTADGIRLTLADEYSHIYVYHLRGNMRKTNWREEGGQIFGAGSQATIATFISATADQVQHRRDLAVPRARAVGLPARAASLWVGSPRAGLARERAAFSRQLESPSSMLCWLSNFMPSWLSSSGSSMFHTSTTARIVSWMRPASLTWQTRSSMSPAP